MHEENVTGDDEDAGCEEDTGDIGADGGGEEDSGSDGDGEDVNNRANRLRRRQLTANRLVNSIDNALDLDNYNPYIIPEEIIKIKSTVKVDRRKENDIHYKFTNRPNNANNVGRCNSANVIRGRQGVTATSGPSTSQQKARCHLCMLAVVGKGHREKKQHVNSMKSLCQSCGKHTCRDHLLQKCNQCL